MTLGTTTRLKEKEPLKCIIARNQWNDCKFLVTTAVQYDHVDSTASTTQFAALTLLPYPSYFLLPMKNSMKAFPITA